jgi:hypothetical protein
MTTPGTQGEVSPESICKAASSAVGSPPNTKPASPCSTGNNTEQNRLNPCRGKPFDLCRELKSKAKKEIPDKIRFASKVATLRLFVVIFVSAAWPWFAVAALGAYHGLDPSSGWLFAVALGLQDRSRARVVKVAGKFDLDRNCSWGDS